MKLRHAAQAACRRWGLYFNRALLLARPVLADKHGVNSELTCFLLRETLETKFGLSSKQRICHLSLLASWSPLLLICK